MRKANKIMMATVSTLLTLTLVSSCILSGLYAKYVTKESSLVTVSFKRFGVTVTAEVNSDLATMAGKPALNTTDTDTTASVTYNNIKLAPGDTYLDAVKFTVSGTADVPVRVTITCNAGYYTGSTSNNTVFLPNGYCGYEGSSPLLVIPLGYTFGAKDANGTSVIDNCYVVEPWRFGSSYTANNVDNVMTTKMLEKINFDERTPTKSGASYSTIQKDFKVGEEIVFSPKSGNGTINQFEFGFVWPFDESSQEPLSWTRQNDYKNYNLDEITMYYESLLHTKSAKDEPLFNFVYSIKIEQIPPNSNS